MLRRFSIHNKIVNDQNNYQNIISWKEIFISVRKKLPYGRILMLRKIVATIEKNKSFLFKIIGP